MAKRCKLVISFLLLKMSMGHGALVFGVCDFSLSPCPLISLIPSHWKLFNFEFCEKLRAGVPPVEQTFQDEF